MQQKVKDLQKECSKWSEKYDQLLQKNQNDLIKIRLREKQLNETIGKLQKQKQDLRKTYENEIANLKSELQRLRSVSKGKSPAKNITAGQLRSDLNSNNVSQEVKRIKQQNQQLRLKVKNYQNEMKKSIKQSIQLTAQSPISKPNKEQQQNYKKQLDQQKLHSRDLQSINKDLQQTVTKLKQQNAKKDRQIKEFQRINVHSIEKERGLTHEHNMKELQKKREVQGLHSQIQRLRQLLTLTNTQYNQLMHKQELKQELLQAKNEELNQMTEELKTLQQKLQQYKDYELIKMKLTDEQRRMEEIMQENALVKEMLKSHKTMIKIKDNEIERLKQKTTTPDAK